MILIWQSFPLWFSWPFALWKLDKLSFQFIVITSLVRSVHYMLKYLKHICYQNGTHFICNWRKNLLKQTVQWIPTPRRSICVTGSIPSRTLHWVVHSGGWLHPESHFIILWRPEPPCLYPQATQMFCSGNQFRLISSEF